MSFLPSDEICQLLKDPAIRALLVTDAQANTQVDFPMEFHPSRMRFLGDAIYGYYITRSLFFSYPLAQAGGLTKMRSDIVSSGSFARYYDAAGFDVLGLNLRNEKPKEKIVEALIGIAATKMNWDISVFIYKDMQRMAEHQLSAAPTMS